MSAGYTNGGFGARGFGGGGPAGFGGGGFGGPLADALGQFRSMFEQRVAPVFAGGDVRAAILAVLADGPKHGNQIIAVIAERSGGFWKPSPSAVYPTLQLLVDEGLLTAEATDGRKTYTLTEAGKAEADAASDRSSSSQGFGARDFLGVGPLPKAGVDLAHAAAQVRRTGTPEQVEQAVAVLDEARRKLYAILAQD